VVKVEIELMEEMADLAEVVVQLLQPQLQVDLEILPQQVHHKEMMVVIMQVVTILNILELVVVDQEEQQVIILDLKMHLLAVMERQMI
jgi:hypothetical protein